MAEQKWFVMLGGKQVGPLSSSEVRKLAVDGKITPDSRIRRDGMDKFVPAARVKGLFPPVQGEQPAGVAAGTSRTAPAASAGDRFTEECFDVPYQEVKDERNYSAIVVARDLVNAANSKRSSEALALAERLKQEMPDYYLSYWWTGDIHASAGRLEQARAALTEGLEKSRTKVSLLAKLGAVEYDAGQMRPAVRWWVHSVVLQVTSGNLNNHNPFLYLAHIADHIGVVNSCRALLDRCDRIHSAKPRLSPVATSRLCMAIDAARVEQLPKLLRLVHERYL